MKENKKEYKYKEYIANVMPCIFYGVVCGAVTGAFTFFFKLTAKWAEEISRWVYSASRGSWIWISAVFCGLVLSIVCFVKIWLVDRMLLGNYEITLIMDAVVCLALAVTVLLAKLVGAVLPMAAKALKLDPAVMASPFITSIVDAVSLLVYFLFAKLLLNL